MKEMRAELDDLKKRVEKNTMRYEELMQLEKLHQQAQRTLGRVREVGNEAWTILREQAEKANDSLREKIIQLGKKLEAEKTSAQN